MHRAAVFLHWDKNNIIDDYVVYYLTELSKTVQDIYFVSNSDLSQTELAKLVLCTKRAECRKNVGLDFGAWKDVLEKIGFDEVAERYDEVVLANDSCYGPLFPFSEMFNKMARQHCDFWGMTKNLNPLHVQSYFYVLRKSALKSQAFRDFFSNFNYGYNRDETILNCELAFTEILCQAGFCYEVYADYDESDVAVMHERIGASDVWDMTIYYWPELVDRRMPLLKVKALPKYVELFSRPADYYFNRLQTMLLQHESPYNCQLINNHQRRIYFGLYKFPKRMKDFVLCYFKIIKRKLFNR